jgi:hypothetical protein
MGKAWPLKEKKPEQGAATGLFWHIDVMTIQEFYMKGISSMDFSQHGKVFYFYGQALTNITVMGH